MKSRKSIEFSKTQEFNAVVEAIKRGNVCLWIGSGMSIAAGYPSVSKLIEILKYELTEDVVAEYIEENEELGTVADIFEKVHAKGRTALNEILTREFSNNGSISHFHDLLVRVPYFKSIITTNYDSLIEDTYTSKRCVVIRKPQDFLNGSQSVTKVFKVHGCLQSLDDVIITKSDYERLYRRTKKSILSILDSEIIRYQYHLFIGYGFNDGNIRADFDYVQKHLLGNSKNKLKLFHVSPSDLKPKQSLDFLSKKIHHFSVSGDTFLHEVIKSLKASISVDLSKGIIDVSNAKKFVESFDLKVSFDDSLTSISSIYSLENETMHQFSFESNNEYAEDFQNFLKGDNRFEFTIAGDVIKEINYNVEGFSLLNKDNFSNLKLQRVPSKVGKVSFYFPNVDYRVDFDKYTLYAWENGFYKIVIQKGVHQIEFDNLDGEGTKLKFNVAKGVANKTDALQFYKTTYLCFSGEVFNALLDSGESFLNKTLIIEEAKKMINTRIKFYNALIIIENYYSRRFKVFNEDEVSNEDYLELLKASSLISTGYYDEKDSNSFGLVELDASAINNKIKVNTVVENIVCLLVTNKPRTFTVLDFEMKFKGIVMLFFDPYIYEEEGCMMVKSDKRYVRYTYVDSDYYKSIPKTKKLWSK